MPSFTARIAAFVLRKTGVYRKLFSGGPEFHQRQAKVLAVPSEPSAKLKARLSISSTEFQGRPVWDIAPKDRSPSLTMLYWHGGGYVYPPMPGHWAFAAHMARVHGWRMILPLYPLAPMAEVGEVTGFALDLYKHIIGKPETARLGIELRDPILTIRGIREAGEIYAGAAGTIDSRVSPIHADWSGLPPILAFGGSDDILVVDSRDLGAKLPSVEYIEGSGLMHDWPIFGFPESRAAQARMARFAAA